MKSESRPGRPDAEEDRTEPDPRRWRALFVLGAIHFMLVLDVTVVNVALPRIQQDLGFSQPGLAWVVNGYVVMAGGLLLLGGRVADIFGRRRLFMIGVTLFAVASAVSGAAVNSEMMIVGRFAQGVGEALAAPASLGLIVLLFPDDNERAKALGIWGGLTSLAGVAGAVISGMLTDLASWRWIFFINLPIALYGLVMVVRMVPESKMVREGQRLDFTGAVTGTGGLIAIVYGLLQAAEHPWDSGRVLLPLIGGLLLLAAMVVIEARSSAPLIPLSFFRNRTRVTANIVSVFFGAAFFSYVFLLSLLMQQVLGYSPLEAGLAGLPGGIAIVVGIGLGAALLMPMLGAKPVMAGSFLGSAVGLFLLSGVGPDSQYVTGIMPGIVLMGLFCGIGMPAVLTAAMHKVTSQDSSLASGVQDTMAQVGTAIGLACLVTLAVRHAAGEVRDGVAANTAIAGGYALSFRVAGLILVVGAVLIVLFLEQIKDTGQHGGAPAKQPESAS